MINIFLKVGNHLQAITWGWNTTIIKQALPSGHLKVWQEWSLSQKLIHWSPAMRSQYNLTWQISAKAQQNTFALPQKHGDYMRKVRAQILNKRGRVLKPCQKIGPPATTGPKRKAGTRVFNTVCLTTGTQRGPGNTKKYPKEILPILVREFWHIRWSVTPLKWLAQVDLGLFLAGGQYWPKSFHVLRQGLWRSHFYLWPSDVTPKDEEIYTYISF